MDILLNSSNFKDSNAPNFESSYLKKGTSLQNIQVFLIFLMCGLLGLLSIFILHRGVPTFSLYFTKNTSAKLVQSNIPANNAMMVHWLHNNEMI